MVSKKMTQVSKTFPDVKHWVFSGRLFRNTSIEDKTVSQVSDKTRRGTQRVDTWKHSPTCTSIVAKGNSEIDETTRSVKQQ